MNELLSTYDSIVIFVHFLEDIFDGSFRISRLLQKECYLIVRNVSGVVDVEVGKGLFEVLLIEDFFKFQASHDELSEVDVSRTIGIDDPHQKAHPPFWNVGLGLEGR